MPLVQTHVRDVVLFQCLGPWSDLALANLTDSDTLILWIVTSCIINTVCQFFSGTKDLHQYHRSDFWTVSCRYTSKKASDHVPHITDQFIAYTGNTDLAILRNKDTVEPDPAVFAFNEASTSKGTWSMVLFIAGGLLRRPSLSGTRTVTFGSHLIQHDITSPLFFLPLKLRVTCVASAVQRHAAALWRA